MIIKKRRVEGKPEVTTLVNYDKAVRDGISCREGSWKMVCGPSYIPKDNEQKPQGEDAPVICAENSCREGSWKMVCGACYIPKDNEQKSQGEDAYFICAEKHAIGVADGVGGWAKTGVDAGEYARKLMTNAAIAILQEPINGDMDPRRVLNEAFLNTKAKGSSTACIALLKDQHLHAINVGDSGFMIFRNKSFLYQSSIQQHYFNCPYQLGNSKNSDRPCSAREIKVAVVPGDIIVLGTDGLLDNMYPAEIEDVLKKWTLEGVNPEQLALTIAEMALYNSLDKYCYSPFARAARLAGRERTGGKIDDITVIVAHVVPQN